MNATHRHRTANRCEALGRGAGSCVPSSASSDRMMDNSARMGGARCLAAVPVVLLLCLVGFSHRSSTSSLFEELAGFIGRGLPGNGAPAPSPCPNTRVYGPPNTLHAALTNVDTYNFYPIEVPSSLDMDSNFCATSGHGRNAVDRWSLVCICCALPPPSLAPAQPAPTCCVYAGLAARDGWRRQSAGGGGGGRGNPRGNPRRDGLCP